MYMGPESYFSKEKFMEILIRSPEWGGLKPWVFIKPFTESLVVEPESPGPLNPKALDPQILNPAPKPEESMKALVRRSLWEPCLTRSAEC